jgi:hypothetical protein
VCLYSCMADPGVKCPSCKLWKLKTDTSCVLLGWSGVRVQGCNGSRQRDRAHKTRQGPGNLKLSEFMIGEYWLFLLDEIIGNCRQKCMIMLTLVSLIITHKECTS